MGIFMNTRRSGTTTGHVTAELEALTNEATIGTGNFVFEAGDNFAIAVTPGTGEVKISSGIFSWCGRLGGVDAFESVNYNPPGSETLYKKVVIGAKYSKNSASLVESVLLTALESEVQASESAAAGITINFENENISAVTENAFFPLWEFVASSNSHTEPVQLFNKSNNIKFLLQEINNLKTEINEEKENRENADFNTNNRIDSIIKGYELIEDNIISQTITNVQIDNYIAFVLMIQVKEGDVKLEPFIIPAIEGFYYFPRYKFEEREIVGGFNVSVKYASAQVMKAMKSILYTDQGGGLLKKLYGIK